MAAKRTKEEATSSTVESSKKQKVESTEGVEKVEDKAVEQEEVSEQPEETGEREAVKADTKIENTVKDVKNTVSETEKAEGEEAEEAPEKSQSSNDPAIDPAFGASSTKDKIIADNTLKLADVPIRVSSTDPTMISKIKKLNHKEVERRRRETINNAIRELQELVPTTHTNKAQIIRKASEFIKKLKEKEENLVNKWTLEKIITDQAISELANSNEKLKIELEKAYREIEHRKHVFENFTTLVSKQENSEEISKFLSRVNDLFEEDGAIEEHEEEFAKKNGKEDDHQKRDSGEETKEKTLGEKGNKEEDSVTTEG